MWLWLVTEVLSMGVTLLVVFERVLKLSETCGYVCVVIDIGWDCVGFGHDLTGRCWGVHWNKLLVDLVGAQRWLIGMVHDSLKEFLRGAWFIFRLVAMCKYCSQSLLRRWVRGICWQLWEDLAIIWANRHVWGVVDSCLHVPFTELCHLPRLRDWTSMIRLTLVSFICIIQFLEISFVSLNTCCSAWWWEINIWQLIIPLWHILMVPFRLEHRLLCKTVIDPFSFGLLWNATYALLITYLKDLSIVFYIRSKDFLGVCS